MKILHGYAWSNRPVAGNSWDGNSLKMNFNISSNYSLINALGVNSLSVATDARFIERTGIYNLLAENHEVEPGEADPEYDIDSSVTTFSNGETIQNEEGTQKRVIQYIFIGNK